jgi:hypothetical protein
MGHTIFIALFSSLATVGMVLLIMWGMSSVDPRRKRYGHNNSEFIGLREMCPETRFWVDGAGGEPIVQKPCSVGRKPFGDRSINQTWRRYPNAVGYFQRAAGGTINNRHGFESAHSTDWM